MSDKRGKKRPKSYYIKCAGGKKFKHANDLAAGMKGFLVTCNKYEKETVREMYNILNEYADQMYGPEVKEVEEGGSGSEEEDMEKAMAKEAIAMKESASKERRFQNTDSKAKNCIFIRTTVESPCDLAHRIFTDIVTKQVQKARYALRMLPISVTCKTNMDSIREAGEAILKPHFETEFGVGLKYTSVCKIRNNQSVSRTTILPALGKIIHELNPLHRLCHDDPELVIIVEVIRNICCMSVVKDYFQFKKYNFHEVIKKPETCDKVSVENEGDVTKGANPKGIKSSEEGKEETVAQKEQPEPERAEKPDSCNQGLVESEGDVIKVANPKEINSSEERKKENVTQQEQPERTEAIDKTPLDKTENRNETCKTEGNKTIDAENAKSVNSADINTGIETIEGDSYNKESQVEIKQAQGSPVETVEAEDEAIAGENGVDNKSGQSDAAHNDKTSEIA